MGCILEEIGMPGTLSHGPVLLWFWLSLWPLLFGVEVETSHESSLFVEELESSLRIGPISTSWLEDLNEEDNLSRNKVLVGEHDKELPKETRIITGTWDYKRLPSDKEVKAELDCVERAKWKSFS